MSTNQNKYGSNVYPGWVWVLPNAAFDEPNTMSVTRDTVVIGLSVREYLAQPEANEGLLQNREVKALSAGTHSIALFDSDLADIQAFEAMLNAKGMINGERDFTINLPHVYYSMPISKYMEFEVVSPLNVRPIPEEVIL